MSQLSYLVTSTTDNNHRGSLRSAIHYANAHSGTKITFASKLAHHTITLASDLPLLDSNVTIDGGADHITISGAGHHRIFFADSGHITIRNLKLANGFAQGGHGGVGGDGISGGGGMGAGGALFVRGSLNEHTPASVTLVNVAFGNDAAHGGAGGLDPDVNISVNSGGGGGGMGGNGGSNPGGGGGGAFPGEDGGNGPGGKGGGPSGGVGGTSAFAGGNFSGGGGGSGIPASGGSGGFGGGGGGSSNLAGGSGGFGGGGGGAQSAAGGSGGFGGGGGGGGSSGPGGFGGGDGGRSTADGGGGGAGMGGAVFVMQGARLTIAGASKLAGSSVQGGSAGAGGTDGQAFGGGMFLQGSGTVRFNPGLGQTEHVFNAIDDEAGVVSNGYTPPSGFTSGRYTLVKSGLGTLVLSAHNAYSGGTILKGGTLDVAAPFAPILSSAASGITFAGNATLKIDGGAITEFLGAFFFDRSINSFGQHDVIDLTGLHFHHGAAATYDAAADVLRVHSGGLTNGLVMRSPHGTHFAVANDGHGGTEVTLAPVHQTVAVAALSGHEPSAHWAGDHLVDYLIAA